MSHCSHNQRVSRTAGGNVVASVSADASARCTKVAHKAKRTLTQAIIRFLVLMLLNYIFWVVVLKVRPDVAEALRGAQERGWMGIPKTLKSSVGGLNKK